MMVDLAPVRMAFKNLKKGMRVRIASIAGPAAEQARIQEMGLVEGTEFRVVKVAPFGDPVEIDVRGYRLCLRKADTLGILVEPII